MEKQHKNYLKTIIGIGVIIVMELGVIAWGVV